MKAVPSVTTRATGSRRVSLPKEGGITEPLSSFLFPKWALTANAIGWLVSSFIPETQPGSGFEATGAAFGHRDDGRGFTDLVKLDDVGGRLAVFDEIDDLDAGSLQVVHERAGAGGEEGVTQVGRNGDDEAESCGDEALIDALGDISRGGEAVGGRDAGKGIQKADEGAEQADEGANVSDGIQEAEEAFQTGDFELTCLLDDFFELLPRGVMPEEGGVDDATRRDTGGDAFLKCLGEISAADEG